MPAAMSPALARALAAFRPGLPLGVAFSGGADSTALLLACARRWPGQVRALHVHHGLQSAADDFEAHCHRVCQQLDVPLRVRRVDARAAPGDSPEAAARAARYRALHDSAREDGDVPLTHLALAQHADDQIETLLLALSRGAGLPGLAAMPACALRTGIAWHRPLLQVPGPDLRQWLMDQGQAWVEDPSNQDERYTRNRIRRVLLPALQACFPQFRATLARSAAHAAQAAQLLVELAQQDLCDVGNPPVIGRLQALSPPRQANVLRFWLVSVYQTTATAAQLRALQQQLAACTTRGHRIHLKIGRGFSVREGDCLVWRTHA